MARTLNGEVLIDANGNFNEGLWLFNLIQLYETYYSDKTDETHAEEDGDTE